MQGQGGSRTALRAAEETVGAGRHAIQGRLDTAVALGMTVRNWREVDPEWANQQVLRYQAYDTDFRAVASPPKLVQETTTAPPKPFSVQPMPDFQPTVDEILEKRLRESQRRINAREARELIHIKVGINGPFGILHFGDPHLDDAGTDIGQVMHHMQIVQQTPGLFAGCVGDFINNWRGKLAFLHAAQSTTQMEALKLLEWFIRDSQMPWMYLVGGNHDVWNGDGDPMQWLNNGAAYEWHQCRMGLLCPNGREIRINCRHDWPGRSMYGPAHGPAKGAMFDGRDHIYIAGHIHDWEHRTQEGAEGRVWHAIRVGSYKRVDDHALKLGFAQKQHGAAVLTVFDPDAEDETDLVSVHWGIEQGARFLASLREKWESKRRA